METTQIDSIIEHAAFLIAEENLSYESAWHQAYLKTHPQVGMSIQANLRHCPTMPVLDVKKAIVRYLLETYGNEYTSYLRHLHCLAWVIMQTFKIFQPVLVGAAASDTATSESNLHIHLYTDETKSVMLELTNMHIPFETFGENDLEITYQFDFNQKNWNILSEPLRSQHLLPNGAAIFEVQPRVFMHILPPQERFNRKKNLDVLNLEALQKKLAL